MEIHRKGHRMNGCVLMLYGQKEEEVMAMRLQGLYRKRKARQHVRMLISKIYDKRCDPESGYFYYINTITNEVKWEKPLILKQHDIEVKEGWEPMVNVHMIT